MRHRQQDELVVLADFYMDGLVNKVVEWVVFQVRMREIALRGSWVHGGGVAGQVIYHAPEAIR
jgi:hypothetical protein